MKPVLVFLLLSIVGSSAPAADDPIIYKGMSDSIRCVVEITFKSPKVIDVRITIIDEKDSILVQKTCVAKLYPHNDQTESFIEFAADVYTCSFGCPLTVFVERESRLRITFRDDGCFSENDISPISFGTLFRAFTGEPGKEG